MEDVLKEILENEEFEIKVENKRINQVFFSIATNWNCSNCKKKIKTLEKHYHCFECCNSPFDLCQKCYEETKQHKHKNVNFFSVVSQPRVLLLKYLSDQFTDSISVILECFGWYKDRQFIGIRDNVLKHFKWFTYKKIEIMIQELCFGLKDIGVIRDKFIGIVCNQRIEYVVIMFACLYLGAVFIPIHTKLSFENKMHIINQTEKEKWGCIIVLDKFIEEFKELYDDYKIVEITDQKKGGKTGYLFSDLMKIGKTKNKNNSLHHVIHSNPEDLLMVIYTSGMCFIWFLLPKGTTGYPKGICIKEKTFHKRLINENIIAFPLVKINYNPFSHNSGIFSVFECFFNGGHFALNTNSDIKNLFDDMKELNPTLFATQPRILNYIYNQYNELCLKKDEETVKESFKSLLGNRLTHIVVGSAKSSTEVRSFIRNLFQIPVYDAFGSSETGTITFNFRVKKGVEYKIIDVPELGYFVSDRKGELLIRNFIANGLEYYKDEKTTKRKIDSDGWFHTSDIVEMDESGTMIVVIDRKNNCVKLQNGEFVQIERLETIFETSGKIKEIVIYPTPSRSILVALVFSSLNEIGVIKEINEVATKKKLNQWEIPRNIKVVNFPFCQTESQKKNRRKIMSQYENEIRVLFKKEIISMFSDVIRNFDKEKSFLELGGDSMTGTRLVNNLKKKGVQLNYTDLMKNNSLEEIINKISLGENTRTLVTFNKESKKIQLLMKKFKNNSNKKVEKIETIFVTGGSGFIGRFIVSELFSQMKSILSIICLVRDKKKISKWFKGNNKVSFICGDLASNNFGLLEKQFVELTEKVDFIIYCGANVNHFLGYNDLYQENVWPIFDLVKLSQGYKPVLYISSLSVIKNKNLRLEDQQFESNLGYQSTKWVMDVLIKKHFRNSIIFRLPLVIGSRKDGFLNKKDWLNRILYTIIQLKVSPSNNIDNEMNLIPVDYLSYVIVKVCRIILLKEKSFTNCEFNLCVRNVSLKDMITFIDQYFIENGETKTKKLEFSEWIKKLKECKKDHPIFPFIEMFKQFNRIGGTFVEFKSSFEKYLVGEKFECPKMSFVDMKKYISSLVKE